MGKRIVDIRQAIVLAYVEADVLIAIMIGLVYLVLPFQSEDIADHRLVILLRGCNRGFAAKVVSRGVLPLLADNLAQIVRLNTAFCILLVLPDMVDGILWVVLNRNLSSSIGASRLGALCQEGNAAAFNLSL